MFRFKTIFGDRLSSRVFDNRATAMFVKCAVLNRMMQLCKPDSYAVTGLSLDRERHRKVLLFDGLYNKAVLAD
jgi:hypothetical protein